MVHLLIRPLPDLDLLRAVAETAQKPKSQSLPLTDQAELDGRHIDRARTDPAGEWAVCCRGWYGSRAIAVPTPLCISVRQ